MSEVMADKPLFAPGVEPIPLRWFTNREYAEFAFGGGRVTPPLTYFGAPIDADFELSLESLTPYARQVLDIAAPMEGAGIDIKLVEIKGGKVKVW